MRRTISISILVLVAIAIGLPSVAVGCPTCKQGIAEASNNPNLVRGYGWSIVFMMSSPFLILTGLGSYFYYEICKARSSQRKSAPRVPLDQTVHAI